MTTILFLHGWHSVPGGVKPTYLKDHGHEVINPALDDDDFEAAVATAQAEFDKHQPQVVVGSSRGGAVAMNINSGDAKLVVMCPAWKNHYSPATMCVLLLTQRFIDGEFRSAAQKRGRTTVIKGRHWL